jgi:Cu(I)/Ag(I) efflux system membrane protein CusA/SilA
MIVVSLVCILFLLHARSALVAIFVVPSSVLVSLLIMHLLGINANIMSLGGIAIAIGVVVDSAIIMVENAHKHLDFEEERVKHGAQPRPAAQLILEAARKWARASFSVCSSSRSASSGLRLGRRKRPALPAAGVYQNLRDGRRGGAVCHDHSGADGLLHHAARAPQAMGADEFSHHPVPLCFSPPRRSVSSPSGYRKPRRIVGGWHAGWIVLAAMLLVPQKITHEEANPISRGLQKLYEPFFYGVIRYRWVVLIFAGLFVASAIWPYSRLGSEFMPPLDEGDLLYMPTTDPSISVTKARQVLQQTDKLIKTFPEVVSVYGKMGRADTATDPAPLDMVESVVRLNTDPTTWRTRKIHYWFDAGPRWLVWPLHHTFWPEQQRHHDGTNWSTAGTIPIGITRDATPSSFPRPGQPLAHADR